MKFWLLVLTAFAAAICTLLSSAPVGFGLATFVAVYLYIQIAIQVNSSRLAFLVVFLTQVPLWLWLHYWMQDLAFYGWIAMGFYMSIWAPLFVVLLRTTQRSNLPLIIVAPTLWVALECIRGIILFDGYPWFLAGLGLLGVPIASIASIGSIWLASYFVVTVSALFASIRNVRWWTIASVAAVSIFFFGYGKQQKNTGPRIDVAVIQTNVSTNNKVARSWDELIRDVSDAVDLTIEASLHAKIKPSLLIWPETMLPGRGFEIDRLDFAPWDERFTSYWYWSEQLRLVVQRLDTPMLVGTNTWLEVEVIEDGEYLRAIPTGQFNSAVLVHPNGDTSRYDKTFLTPFGERLPYIDIFSSVKEWVRERVGTEMLFDLDVGGSPTRFSLPCSSAYQKETDISFATPICYEGTVPSVARDLIWVDGKRVADVLINLSNDGWFGTDTGARLQYVREARMRCIENMTPMLKAANTGKSCLINQYGHVIPNDLKMHTSGILPAKVFAGMGKPLSRFIGDSVAWICLIGGILLILRSYVGNSHTVKGQEDENSN